jgi:hypothetical protein
MDAEDPGLGLGRGGHDGLLGWKKGDAGTRFAGTES